MRELMRERIRLCLAACFYYSGLVALALRWQRRFRRRLIILNYHRASGENLRRQFDYLRRHYHVMHIEAALDTFFAHSKGTTSLDTGPLPLVLTFDDGYRDNYTYLFPLARELQIPVTIYLVPGYLQDGGYFWWLECKQLVHHAGVEEVTLDGHTYSLQQTEDRQTLTQAIDHQARYARSVKEREAFLARIRQELAVPEAVVVEEGSQPLTWAEVHEMANSEWVSFGAHTMHHPPLVSLEDAQELQFEVSECRRILEERLGYAVRSFAYPIGKPEHFGEKGLQAVQAAGYEWALTTIEMTNTPQVNPYLLGRLPGDKDQHWLILASELAGLLGNFSRLKKKRGPMLKMDSSISVVRAEHQELTTSTRPE